jgi:hypothetical protein
MADKPRAVIHTERQRDGSKRVVLYDAYNGRKVDVGITTPPGVQASSEHIQKLREQIERSGSQVDVTGDS